MRFYKHESINSTATSIRDTQTERRSRLGVRFCSCSEKIPHQTRQFLDILGRNKRASKHALHAVVQGNNRRLRIPKKRRGASCVAQKANQSRRAYYISVQFFSNRFNAMIYRAYLYMIFSIYHVDICVVRLEKSRGKNWRKIQEQLLPRVIKKKKDSYL